MTEGHPHAPESMPSAAPVKELYRDPAMTVQRVKPGENSTVYAVGDAIASHETGRVGVGNELRGVVNADGENYVICSTTLEGQRVSYVAKAGSGERGAEFVNFIGYGPLTVKKADETGLDEQPLFTLQDNTFGITVKNDSYFSDVHVANSEVGERRSFSPRFMWNALKRSVSGRRGKPYFSDTAAWEVSRDELETRYAERPNPAMSWTSQAEPVAYPWFQGDAAAELGTSKPTFKTEVTDIKVYEDTPEVEETKEYITTFKVGPEFKIQLAEAKAGERQNSVRYEPSTITPDREWVYGDERKQVSEGDALLHLDAFLERAATAAEAAGDMTAAERARASRDNIAYLGEKEFEESTAAISRYWAEYLKSDPTNRIFVYKPQLVIDRRKSSDYVGEQIAAKLAEDDDKSLADRVTFIGPDVSALDGADAKHSKVLIVDDWIGRGAMIKSTASDMAGWLRRGGKEEFMSAIEANLLMVCDDHVATKWTYRDKLALEDRELPMVAYYRSRAQSGIMRPFGTHGSNDLNFTYFKDWGAIIAAQTGTPIELPEVAVIDHPYRTDAS